MVNNSPRVVIQRTISASCTDLFSISSLAFLESNYRIYEMAFIITNKANGSISNIDANYAFRTRPHRTYSYICLKPRFDKTLAVGHQEQMYFYINMHDRNKDMCNFIDIDRVYAGTMAISDGIANAVITYQDGSTKQCGVTLSIPDRHSFNTRLLTKPAESQ